MVWLLCQVSCHCQPDWSLPSEPWKIAPHSHQRWLWVPAASDCVMARNCETNSWFLWLHYETWRVRGTMVVASHSWTWRSEDVHGSCHASQSFWSQGVIVQKDQGRCGTVPNQVWPRVVWMCHEQLWLWSFVATGEPQLSRTLWYVVCITKGT